jgi:catechol 2,3-dioxygenase-like lactoylglutathione lyase family enzyme
MAYARSIVTRTAAAALLFASIVHMCAASLLAQKRWLNKGEPVVYGHYHLYVPDMDAQKKFWTEALGAHATGSKAIPMEAMEYPNALVDLVKRAAPADGSKRTAVAHIALQVPNLRAAVDRVKKAGYPVVTSAMLPAGAKVTDGIGTDTAQKRTVAFVRGPDDVAVELVENKQATAVTLDHIHLEAPDVAAMQAWYVKTFGFKAGKRGSVATAEFPGGSLLFSVTTAALVPTKGQIVDHIAFEISDLEAFCGKLPPASLSGPFTQFKPPALPGTAVGVCFATDPWGVYIELNEGQEKLWLD